MRRFESYQALEPVLSAQLGRGVRTNAFSSPEEYRQEIAEGRLFWEESPQGLLLFHQRDGFWRVNFYLRGGEAPQLALDRPAVMEIAFRSRDAALAETVKLWEAKGFRRTLTRRRLARPKDAPLNALKAAEAVEAAGPEELEAVEKLLKACFHPLWGCLPTRKELLAALEAGEVLALRRDGLAGLLHFSTGRGGGQIRHLAVREDARGRGLGGVLLEEYLARTGGERSLVWTGEDNAPALGLYKKHRFAEDGWSSAVLCRF